MKLFLLAGEASGDRLGAALIEGVRALGVEPELAGVGGPRMAEAGLRSLFPMEELSVMGIAEVLPRYPALRRRLGETIAAVTAIRPDALVTIDAPDFGLRVAKAVKPAGVRTVHYVAPSVWAWRPGRAASMARYVDQVLALLPFEPPYFEAVGLRCDFVGHPVVAEPQAEPGEVAAFRAGQGIGAAPLLLVLPGSRRSEVVRLAPVFGATLERLAAERPAIRVVVPAAGGVAETVAQAIAGWPGRPVLLRPDERDTKRAAFAAADAALAASGTVSLELAAAGTPMVVAYDMNWLTWQMVTRMARIDTATLVNLVTGTRVIPEFLGPRCRPELVAPAVGAVLDAPGAQAEALSQTMERLGRGGEPPGIRAARALIDGLGTRPA